MSRNLIRIALRSYKKSQFSDVLNVFNINQIHDYCSIIQLRTDIPNQSNKVCLIQISEGKRGGSLKTAMYDATTYQNNYIRTYLINSLKMFNQLSIKKKCLLKFKVISKLYFKNSITNIIIEVIFFHFN